MDRRGFVLGILGGASAGSVGCRALIVRGPSLPSSIDPVTPVGQFYVYSCCGEPEVDANAAVVVRSAKGELARFTQSDVEALASQEREHTLQCVGSHPGLQLISNGVWTGVTFGQLFDALGIEIPGDTRDVVLWGHDGYHAAIPVEDLEGDGLFIAYALNGVALPREHGFPLRVLVPGRYGMKNVKWLREIEFVAREHVSFYTPDGWTETAVIRPNGFVASPPDGLVIEAGETIRVVGTAFAGSDPVTRVEVSLDGGAWVDAEVDYSVGGDIWVLWSYVWAPGGRGEHQLQVRVTTEGGAQSSPEPFGTDASAGYDGGMLVTLNVQ